MKRFWMILLTTALAVAIAAPVGAGKPICDPDDPNHTDRPACRGHEPGDDLPIGGTTCDPSEYPDGIVGVQDGDFTFTLSGKSAEACIDVMSAEGAWVVTISDNGAPHARYLGVVARDSFAPGDSCGGHMLRHASNIYPDPDNGANTNTLILGGDDGIVPAATINACGTDFAEWVDTALVADDVCVLHDGDQCMVIEQVSVPHPLVLHAFLSGSADGETTFTVDIP